MANKKDYYAVLGISRSAPEAEIKVAYKKLAKQWHPDVNKSPHATERFKEISEAYLVLSNAQKRQTYDQFGSDAANQGFSGFGQGSGGMSGFDFSDFFGGSQGGFSGMDDFIRQAFGGEFYSENARSRAKPLHVRVDVELEFEEAAFGATKTIHVTHQGECDKCGGSGSVSGKKQACTNCKGRGMETHTQRTPFGLFQTTAICSHCQGKGEMLTDPCKTCHGNGSVQKTSMIEVAIPGGVDTGNHLRVPKQGNFSDGKKGDVYVVLHVKPHPLFKRDGEDVYMEKTIPYPDAVLGGEVEVPILGNKTATLTIPPGTKPGAIFRLKGKGIKVLNESAYGDEYVKVEIEVPGKLSNEEKELLEQLRSLETKEGKELPKSKKKGFLGFN
jgi:molecular chaperone DnaJ